MVTKKNLSDCLYLDKVVDYLNGLEYDNEEDVTCSQELETTIDGKKLTITVSGMDAIPFRENCVLGPLGDEYYYYDYLSSCNESCVDSVVEFDGDNEIIYSDND